MVTNLIHLNRYEFLNQGQFSGDPALWLAFLLLIAGIAVGCGFGSLSLIIVQRRIAATYGATWSWVAVAGASLLSGIAIWIGRVLRFNSWDILFQPFYLIHNVSAQLDWSALLTCMLFAIMSAGVYLLLVLLFPSTRITYYLNEVDQMKRMWMKRIWMFIAVIAVGALFLGGFFHYEAENEAEVRIFLFMDSTGTSWRVLAENEDGNQLIITELVHGLTQYNSADAYTVLGQSDRLRPALDAWFANSLAPELQEVALEAHNVNNDVRSTAERDGDFDVEENEAAGWSVAGGIASQENPLFILSISEVNKYKETGTLDMQGMAYLDERNIFVPAVWWLRSPGSSPKSVATVSPGDTVVSPGDTVGPEISTALATEKHGFRPALWIDRIPPEWTP